MQERPTSQPAPRGRIDTFCIIWIIWSSIFIRTVCVGLVETGPPALEQRLPEVLAEVGVVRVLLQARHVRVVFWGALLLDDEHARGVGLLPGESMCTISYSIPFDSRRLLLFLAVPNM